MDSNFHYTIDLNEDQNHQPFFSPLGSSLHHNNHQAPFNPSSASSSLTSPSLSYFPFLTNSHQDQEVQAGYNNNNTFHGFLDPHLSQSFESKKFVSNGGSSSSDQMVPKKETRLKLTIRKKDNHREQIDIIPQYPTKGETETNSTKWVSSKVRLMKRKTMITTTDNNKQHVNSDQSLSLSNLEGDHHDYLKKISTDQYNIIVNENGYNGSNNCVIRTCSDCNTTKTPLWRSGPRGPKSLCNACGIRQRKARRAAAAATATSNVSTPLLKTNMKNKNKRSNEEYNLSSPLAPKVKKCKRMITSEEEAGMEAETARDFETQSKSAVQFSLSTSSSSNKVYFDDLAIVLSKSSAYQQVFPQDEKEAAILLMALSYGMVHG